MRVNWQEISQPSYTVKGGGLIAVRGKVRLEVGKVTVTQKQRYRVQFMIYI